MDTLMVRHDGAAARTLFEFLIRRWHWTDKDVVGGVAGSARRLNRRVDVSERTVRRWRAGHATPASPALHEVVEDVFGYSVPVLFGPADTDGAKAAMVQDPADVRGMVKSAAAEARRINTWLTASRVSPDSLELHRDALAAASADFLHQPAGRIFGELTRIRAGLVADLEQRHHSAYTGELWSLLGMTCVVLAHASYLLGHSHEGRTQARVALACADEVDHVELAAWSFGTIALIDENTGRLRDALAHVRAALERLARSRVPGSAAVRLHSYHARIAARLGHRGLVTQSVAASAHAREELCRTPECSSLDDIGGILAFPAPKAEFYAGQISLLSDEPERAEKHAWAAIEGYSACRDEDRSYGDIALAHIDIAGARLRAGEVAGACQALNPVLSLPPDLRIEPLHGPLTTLAHTLATPPYRGVAVAHDVHESIQNFLTTPRELPHS